MNPKTGRPYGAATKAFTEWAEAQEKSVVPSDKAEMIEKMREGVEASSLAMNLLENGHAEGVVRTHYCSVPSQIRVDWFNPDYGIVDLKTCDDLDFFQFDAKKYRYHNQMAFYQAVMKEVCGEFLPVYKDHGLRRSNADKRRAVELALRHPKGANLSNRRIAKHVGVNEATVRNVRRELETTAEIPQSTFREGADGRLINTSGIGDKAMKYVNHTCSECHLLRNGRCRFSGDPQEPNASACAEYRPIPADVAEVTRDLADVRILDNWGDTGQTSRHVNGHRKRGAISVPLYEDNPLLSGVEIRHIFGEDWLSELYVIIPSLLIKNTEKTA